MTKKNCVECTLGKMHKLPYKQQENYPRVTGELIHVDINRLMIIISCGGVRYYVRFKDNYSYFH